MTLIDKDLDGSKQPPTSMTPRTDSAISIASIKDWLKECHNYHVRCRRAAQKRSKSFLPTRLIDVGRPESNMPARLIVSAALSGSVGVIYLTLSHRWNASVQTTLNTHNLKTFEKQIPVDALSQTFRDAISLAINLGVRYIWIDSLCIIQNSSVDWAHESLKMGEVYKHGYLNIAAVASARNAGGLFINRDSDKSLTVPVHLKWKGHNGIYHCINNQKTKYWSKIDDAELNQRGWVLQERYLSPRTLYFASDQIYWECQNCRSCEAVPRGLKEWGSVKLGLEKLNSNEVSVRWRGIVTAYTKCALTQGQDKLIALSGMAKEFKSDHLGEYLAGMWRKTLIGDLLWVGSTGRPTRYRGR